MRLYFRRILQPSIDPFTEQMCFDTSSTGFFFFQRACINDTECAVRCRWAGQGWSIAAWRLKSAVLSSVCSKINPRKQHYRLRIYLRISFLAALPSAGSIVTMSRPCNKRASCSTRRFHCLAVQLGLVFIFPPLLYLSVVGQVVGTVHELLQGASRPIGALVARRQLLGRGSSSVAHVQGGFPRRAALNVPPLAEVSRHWVPQQGDVVELPVWGQRRG